jgi:hypothetical protein
MIEAAPFSPLMEDDAFLYAITCMHNNKYDWRMPDFSNNSGVVFKLTVNKLEQRRKIQFCPVRGSRDD